MCSGDCRAQALVKLLDPPECLLGMVCDAHGVFRLMLERSSKVEKFGVGGAHADFTPSVMHLCINNSIDAFMYPYLIVSPYPLILVSSYATDFGGAG